MAKVTDPRLLAQLNAGNDAGSRKVSDPNLLAQLNSQQDNTDNGQMGSVMNMIRNMMPSPSMPPGVNIGTGLMSLAFPQQQKEMIKNIPQVMSGQQPGTVAKLSQGLGEQLPLMSTGIGEVPGVMGSLARIGAQSGYNASQAPLNDMGKAATQGAIAGTFGEALPMALKSTGNIAELLNPKKFAGELAETIKNTYGKYKQQASDIYSNLLKIHGNENIYQNPYHGNIRYPFQHPDLESSYNRTLNDMHNEFINNPTYENAQNLQSQMGAYVRKLKKGTVDANTINIMDDVSTARQNLKNDIQEYFKWKQPAHLDKYNEAADITRDVLAPHEESDLISKVAHGLTNDVQPKELLSGLKNISETKGVPQTHYLRGLQDELAKKVSRGNFYNSAGSILGGIGLGETMFPGMGGAGVGASAGALASKFLNPYAIDMAQNKYFTGLLSKLSKGYELGKNTGIGTYLDSMNGSNKSQGSDEHATG